MKTYTIDYGTGITERVTGTLAGAQDAADSGAAYTQCDIVINDDSGAEVARRRWWGVAYDPDATEETEDEIISFGDFGHFGAWDNTCIPAPEQPDYAAIWAEPDPIPVEDWMRYYCGK